MRVLTLVLVVAFWSCCSTTPKKEATAQSASTQPVGVTPAQVPRPAAVPPSAPSAVSNPAPNSPLLVRLKRGACLGACPAYELRVYNDGAVHFVGSRFVALTEPVQARLGEDKLGKLRARLAGASFKRWKDRYQGGTTSDLPTVEIEYGGRTIRHSPGDESAPVELTLLADDIDTIVGSNEWIKNETRE